MDAIEQATSQGWVDKEAHVAAGRSEDTWRSAEEFLAVGQQVMPIMRENNKRLLREVEQYKSTVNNLQQTVKETQESIAALKEFHEQSSAAQVKKAREEILSNLKTAKTEGDLDGEVEATSRLSEFDAAAKVVKVETQKTESAPAQVEIHPEVKAWMIDNPWYGEDDEKTALLDGIGRKMRREGSDLSGKKFLDAALARLEEKYGDKRTAKVDSGSPAGRSQSTDPSFTDLPADAKAVCKKQESQFVGPNKVFKTAKDWQTYYATEYFKGA